MSQPSGGGAPRIAPDLAEPITPQLVREALARGEMFLEYLPVISQPDGRCVGAEALARWSHPEGLVTPDRFIPVIEETPVSGLLTYWVVDTIAEELGGWLRAHDDVLLSINVPPEVLGRGGLEYAAQRCGLLDQATKLVLEITERGLPDRIGAMAIDMAEQTGVRIALDDVLFNGRNLVVLSRCNVHIVKLDRSLVAQIGSPNHPQPPPWLNHLTSLREAATLDIIAEGIETREQLEALTAAGVSMVQGFYFSRPLSARDFIAYHAANR